MGSGAARAADPTITAVGDMACSQADPDYNAGNGTATRCRQRYVSDLVVNPAPAAFLDLGDNQYVNGELSNYQSVYDPTFGRSNPVAYPSLGNAEYGTPGAQGFFDYFSNTGVFARILAGTGDSSNLTTRGFYSFDIGTWHVIALNSNCAEVGGCDAGSPQEAWLRSDLAAHPNHCTLAYWHHPRWNSGALGNDASTAAFWADLYSAGADLVLNGHGNHHYERFKPQDANGAPDAAQGIREFIVSTGGESHGTPPRRPGDQTTSQITNYTSYGVLRLTLHPGGYDWTFVPEAGTTVPPGPGSGFTDSGSGTCHDPAATPPPSGTFPTTGVLDSFARSAGSLGSSWQSPGLVDPGTVSIASSGLTVGSSGASSATWSAGTFAADQEAYLTVPTLPATGDFIQVAGRLNTLSTSNVSCYFLRVTPSTSTWDLRKKINGATSTSIRTFTAPFAAGDAMGLQLVGSTLTAYRKPAGGAWSTVGSATDTTLTAGGYIAFTLGDTIMRGGPFGGGNVSTTPPPPPPPQPPGAPSLSATAGSGTVHLSWTTPAPGSAAIAGYNVYRGASPGSETLLAAVGNVNSYDDGSVLNGTTYYYRVSAVSSVGEGALSNEVSATPTALPPPPAFPTTGVLDSFARSAGSLGSSWQSPGLVDPGTVSIASSGLTVGSSGASSATWSAATFAANQEAYLTVPTLPATGDFIQVAGRLNTLSTSNISCYFLRVTPSTSTWDLRKKINGANSTSIRTLTAPFAAGDAMGLQLIGSTLTAYRKPAGGAWSTVGSTTDTTITAGGYIAFTLGDTTMRGGPFGGGNAS